MNSITIDLPEKMMKVVAGQVQHGNFVNPSVFVQSLILDFVKRNREAIDAKLLEAMDEYERGEYTEWHPGDFKKFAENYYKEKSPKP